ncbi:17221_t:CDS:2, partial [Racocetra persica]
AQVYKAFENDRRLPESTQKAKDMKSLVTSVQDSIGNAGVSYPFGTNILWRSRRSGDICANNNETRELAEDLLSIITGFVARHNGLRYAANHKRRKDTVQAIQKFQEERTARWTYNRCLIVIKKEGVKRKKKDLRARYETMNDLLKGYASNFAANRKNFKMKFCSKKDPQQSIAILFKHWGKSCGEFSFLHKMNSAESLP